MAKLWIALIAASTCWGMQRVQVECYIGNRAVVTGGVNSTTRVLGSYPLCTINVFVTGTSTRPSLFSDNSGTPLANPFTANSNGHGYFYVANGRYDIQLSGGTPSFPTPVTYGDILVVDPTAFTPGYTTNILNIVPSGGTTGEVRWYDSTNTFYVGFRAPNTLTQNITWTLPSSDSAGCLTSNGAGILSFTTCGGSPGGPDTSIQYNNSGSFGGSANNVWSNSQQRVTITGISATPSLVSASGYIQSNGGFLSSISGGNYQGFNSATDGALLRGYGVVANIANTAGGYIDLAPVTYNPYLSGTQCIDEYGNVVTQPLPLGGLSAFGAHDTIMWVGTSPVMPASGSCGVPLPVDLDYGLNINTYLFARGGHATDQPSFNSIHSLRGGVTAVSFTAGGLYNTGTVTACCGTLAAPRYIGGYVQIGHSSGPPSAGTIATVNNPLTQFDGLNQGTMYWDDALHCVNVYKDDNTWGCLTPGGGGGGTPGGANTQVQYNNLGVFAGSPNFTWTNSSSQLTVTGTVNSSVGFVTANTATNSIQAPSGGVSAKWIYASDSWFLAEEAAPALSASGQARVYADSTSHILKVSQNGGAYVPLTGAASTAFSAITTATNTTATMTVGTGSFLTYAGSGVIDANHFNGGTAPASGSIWTSNVSLQPVAAVYTNVVSLFSGGAGCFGTNVLAANGTCQPGGGGGSTVGNPGATFTNSGGVIAAGPVTYQTAVSACTISGYTVWADTGTVSFDVWKIASGTALPTVANTIISGSSYLALTSGTYFTTLTTTSFTTTTVNAFDILAFKLQSVTGSPTQAHVELICPTSGSGGSGTPAPPVSSVQFNNSGSFGGSSNFTWDNAANILTLSGSSTDKTLTGENFITSFLAGVSMHTLWALGKQSGAGILRLSLGTGSGGIDGNGATILGTGSTGEMAATVFNAYATGTSLTFRNANSNFLVDGNGNVSGAGVFSSTGALGGFNVTTNTATNSIQTKGGWKVNVGASGETTFAAASVIPTNTATVSLGGTSNRFNGFFFDTNTSGTAVVPLGGTALFANGSTINTGATTTINWGGKFSQYNGTNVVGMGVAPTYGSVSFSGQTTTQSANLAVSGGIAPAGYYRVSGYLKCDANGTAGSVNLQLSYVPGGGVGTVGLGMPSVTGSSAITCGASATAQTFLPAVIYTNGSAHVAISASVTAAFTGGATYGAGVILERIQ